jgi:hypothetical protein
MFHFQRWCQQAVLREVLTNKPSNRLLCSDPGFPWERGIWDLIKHLRVKDLCPMLPFLRPAPNGRVCPFIFDFGLK